MANERLSWSGDWRGPKNLGTATLGTGWTTIGSAFLLHGARHLAAYVDLTINTSVDTRFRLRSLYESGGSAYVVPISTAGEVIAATEQYIELDSDANQRTVLRWELQGVLPYGQLQASVGTAGGTAATLNSCYLVSAQ